MDIKDIYLYPHITWWTGYGDSGLGEYTRDMTKTHFIEMAAITASISNYETRKFVADQQVAYFATINPNFNSKMYLTACNVKV